MKEINGYFVPEEVLELVRNNRKLEAINRFREFHQVNWETSRTIIEVTAQELLIRSRPSGYEAKKNKDSVR